MRYTTDSRACAMDDSLSPYHIIERIVGIKQQKRKIELLMHQLGCEDDNRTWEVFDRKKENIPGMLEDYLYTARDRNLIRTVLNLHF